MRRLRVLPPRHHRAPLPPPLQVPPRAAGARVPRHLRLPPRRSAAAGRALALARTADFAFSFLPESRTWVARDARDDGLVLLSRQISRSVFHRLVVCDPLLRRYVLVPPIPDAMAAAVPRRGRFVPFLAPAAGEEDVDAADGEKEERSAFTVIYAVESEDKAVAFVFCSGNGKWRRITFHSSIGSLPTGLFGREFLRSYAHGCFFWIVRWTAMDYCFALVLDIREMKFSTIDLPHLENKTPDVAIVEAGDGMLGLLTFDNDSTMSLFRKIWRPNNGGGTDAEEWQPYKTIPFPKDSNGEGYRWFSTGPANGIYLLVVGRESCDGMSSSLPRCSRRYHTLELKTLLLEKLCVLNRQVLFDSRIYARFPPLLAPPCI
ncbi:unnamed protein product [Urochloa humidicola]